MQFGCPALKRLRARLRNEAGKGMSESGYVTSGNRGSSTLSTAPHRNVLDVGGPAFLVSDLGTKDFRAKDSMRSCPEVNRGARTVCLPQSDVQAGTMSEEEEPQARICAVHRSFPSEKH